MNDWVPGWLSQWALLLFGLVILFAEKDPIAAMICLVGSVIISTMRQIEQARRKDV